MLVASPAKATVSFSLAETAVEETGDNRSRQTGVKLPRAAESEPQQRAALLLHKNKGCRFASGILEPLSRRLGASRSLRRCSTLREPSGRLGPSSAFGPGPTNRHWTAAPCVNPGVSITVTGVIA